MKKILLSFITLVVIVLADAGAQDRLHKNEDKPGKLKIGRYTYSGPGGVNTWWIETDTSIIVIDVQRDLFHANEAFSAVKKSGKPVTTILVTHGHPDHYAGIDIFKKAYPNLRTFSSKETQATIANDHYGFNALLQKIDSANFPQQVTVPDESFEDDATISIDGVTIVTRELGKSDANSNTVYYLPSIGVLFAGDIVLPKMHLFFYEQASSEWLSSLDRLVVLFPNALKLYPGHGEAGQLTPTIASVREYITTARMLVVEEINRGSVDSVLISTISAALLKRYPGYGFPANLNNMLEISIKGLAEELRKPKYAVIK